MDLGPWGLQGRSTLNSGYFPNSILSADSCGLDLKTKTARERGILHNARAYISGHVIALDSLYSYGIGYLPQTQTSN